MRQRRRNPSETPTKAIIYARFSPKPKDQVEKTDSIGYQVEACRAYCQAKGYEVIAVHEDREASGATTDREGLQDAIDDAVGCRGILVAYSVSRLTRSMHGMAEIMERLAKGGADMAVLDMSIDTATAVGRLIVDFVVRMHQFEREQTGERTSAAMIHMQRNGRAVGGNPPFGWKFEGEIVLPSGTTRRLMVRDEDEQKSLAYIIKLMNGGMSFRKVCDRLNAEGVKCRAGSWKASKIMRIMARHESGIMEQREDALATATGA